MTRRGRVIPFPKPPSPRAGDEGPAEIHRCDRAEALVVKGLLESEGIPTVLRSRLAHSVHPFTVGTQGEVIIVVPAREAPRAKRLLLRLVG
jgi:hypothetical protein